MDDPLRIKSLPDVASMKVRLAGLAQVTTTPTEAPAIVRAAVVHGELVALRPFDWGSALVARAAARESCWRNVGSIRSAATHRCRHLLDWAPGLCRCGTRLPGAERRTALLGGFVSVPESCAVGARLSIDRLPDLD